MTEQFSEQYRLAQSPLLQEIERAVCGCDYGGTSWTTRHEAHEVADLLGLGPDVRLLEVGAGSGWPSLYWARTTGCDVVLADLPFEGLSIAARRAAIDNLSGDCWLTVADGAALPFKSGSFDAVSHSDVLCCLEPKSAALHACRRVIRSGGTMAFTVISIVPNLPAAEHRRVVAAAPPYVETAVDYPTMLRQTGWTITHHADLTAQYAESVRRHFSEETARADGLRALLGERVFAEKLARRRANLGLVEEGLLRRDLFAATPAPLD